VGNVSSQRQWTALVALGSVLGFLSNEVGAADSTAGNPGASVVLGGRVFRARIENDLIIRTDRHFTHGSQASYLHDEQAWPGDEGGWLGQFVKFLPKFGLKPLAYRWGVKAGQNIYTPDDIETTALVTDDRPYAGYLFAAFSINIRG